MSKKENKIVLYKDRNGKVELRADVEKDTMWASQAQISELFEVNIPTVNEHLKNIFGTNELSKASTIRKFRIVQSEGGRKVKRDMNLYNLDAIIAVGYRVNSKKATQFRIWATKILHEYLVNGYSLNHHQLSMTPEKIEGLQETIELLESNKNEGKLKGKITLKITKDLKSN